MKNNLKFYKDFPKEGIIFVDIIPLMQDKQRFAELTELQGAQRLEKIAPVKSLVKL